MMRFSYFTVFVLVLIACGKKPANPMTAAFHTAQRFGRMSDAALSEASGLAASTINPGYFWIVNDSGNDASVLLVDTALTVYMTCTLAGAENRDWEDLVAGPGPDSTRRYLYVGEIGDNGEKYPCKNIYRFEEPRFTGANTRLDITTFDTLTFRLPDGPKDSEAMFMDRSNLDLYVVSKREKPVYLYRIPHPFTTHDTVTAQQVMALPITTITAADLSPDGREIVMKNYEHIYYWHSPDPVSVVQLLAQPPLEIPYVEEPQGEAMTWAPDGSGFYTISERPVGAVSYLYFYGRR